MTTPERKAVLFKGDIPGFFTPSPKVERQEKKKKKKKKRWGAVKRQKQPRFSFAFVVDEITQKIADRIIVASGERFWTWYNATPARRSLSLKRAFNVWWVQAGSVGFTKFEDARLYKQEAYGVAQALFEEAQDGPAGAGSSAGGSQDIG